MRMTQDKRTGQIMEASSLPGPSQSGEAFHTKEIKSAVGELNSSVKHENGSADARLIASGQCAHA